MILKIKAIPRKKSGVVLMLHCMQSRLFYPLRENEKISMKKVLRWMDPAPDLTKRYQTIFMSGDA